jgi:5-methylcytosine-specific restriction endonuclease McrA
MASLLEASRRIYHEAFVRDGYKCVYCDRDILESFDSFAASHLDHLKPQKAGGVGDDVHNCVTACAVCNSIKGSHDPSPDGPVTADSFATVVEAARKYISEKRDGSRPCSYYRDYQYWLKETGRIS